MSAEQIFSLANLSVLPGWLLLVFAPRWRWTQRFTTLAIPLVLGAVYAWLFVTFGRTAEGGFGSLAAVTKLFQAPEVLLAGWIHYLVFDLFTGSWEARDAGRNGIPHLAVIPCLFFTFLLGPVGLLLYWLLRLALRRNPDVGDGD